MRAWFLSDLHLYSQGDSRLQALLSFLGDLQQGRFGSASHLFFVGDIFDLWIGGHREFSGEYTPLIDRLLELRRSGVEIHYFEGNHDLHLAEYWTGTVGIQVHSGPATFQFDRVKVRVEHGDQMNPSDRGYRLLRWFLRTDCIRFLALRLPGAWISGIGGWMSGLSRRWTNRHTKRPAEINERIRSMIRRHAEKVYRNEPFDFLFAGHVHLRDDQVLIFPDGKRARVVNLGCWPGADRYDRSDESAEATVLEVSGENPVGKLSSVQIHFSTTSTRTLGLR